MFPDRRAFGHGRLVAGRGQAQGAQAASRPPDACTTGSWRRGGAQGSSSVHHYVKKGREEHRPDDDRYLELDWHTGVMQVDFSEAVATIGGGDVKVHCLVATFPHSNMRYVAAMPGENAECVCEGLAQIFDHIGMAPQMPAFERHGRGPPRRVEQGHCGTRVHHVLRPLPARDEVPQPVFRQREGIRRERGPGHGRHRGGRQDPQRGQPARPRQTNLAGQPARRRRRVRQARRLRRVQQPWRGRSRIVTNPPHATADTRRRRVSTGRMDEIMKPARNLPLTRQVFADSLGTTTPAQMEFILSQINEELVSRERPKCARLPKQAGRPYPVVSDYAFGSELVDFVDQVMQELDVPWRPPYPAHALDGGPAGLLATDLDGDIGIRIVGVVHVSVPSMTGSFVPSWGSRAPRTFRPRYGCVKACPSHPAAVGLSAVRVLFASETRDGADIGMPAHGSSDCRLSCGRAHAVGLGGEVRSVPPSRGHRKTRVGAMGSPVPADVRSRGRRTIRWSRPLPTGMRTCHGRMADGEPAGRSASHVTGIRPS